MSCQRYFGSAGPSNVTVAVLIESSNATIGPIMSSLSMMAMRSVRECQQEFPGIPAFNLTTCDRD
jgi:hypothetical protein